MSDRGMKKWAAYASLIEQKGTIVRMKQSKAFEDGKKISEKGLIKQINFDEKWLKINEKTIYFSSLLDIQIQSPINSSTSLLNK